MPANGAANLNRFDVNLSTNPNRTHAKTPIKLLPAYAFANAASKFFATPWLASRNRRSKYGRSVIKTFHGNNVPIPIAKKHAYSAYRSVFSLVVGVPSVSSSPSIDDIPLLSVARIVVVCKSASASSTDIGIIVKPSTPDDTDDAIVVIDGDPFRRDRSRVSRPPLPSIPIPVVFVGFRRQ
jgi:hypothetical protein